jgi:hypothetical protein
MPFFQPFWPQAEHTIQKNLCSTFRAAYISIATPPHKTYFESLCYIRYSRLFGHHCQVCKPATAAALAPAAAVMFVLMFLVGVSGDCLPGWYRSVTDPTRCDPCPADTFSTAGRGAQLCAQLARRGFPPGARGTARARGGAQRANSYWQGVVWTWAGLWGIFNTYDVVGHLHRRYYIVGYHSIVL